eukprot:scaffold51578_cov63-Phaeocystis_antarctica.AAC.4
MAAPHTQPLEGRLLCSSSGAYRELPQAKSSPRRRAQGSPRIAAPPREHQENSLHAFARTILLRVDTLGAAGRAPVLERHGVDAGGGGGGDVDRHDRRVLLAVGVDLATVRRPRDLTEHAANKGSADLQAGCPGAYGGVVPAHGSLKQLERSSKQGQWSRAACGCIA